METKQTETPDVAGHASIEEIRPLAAALSGDMGPIMGFMRAHRAAAEAETMIRQTLIACLVNHEHGRGVFSVKGDFGPHYGPGQDNHKAYATLLRLGYFEEEGQGEEVLIYPTRRLMRALEDHFARR